MSHEEAVRSLTGFSKNILSTMGKELGRAYLRRCIVFWREEYGPDVAKMVGKEIKFLLGDGA